MDERLWTPEDLANFFGYKVETIRHYSTVHPERLPPRVKGLTKPRWVESVVRKWAKARSVPQSTYSRTKKSPTPHSPRAEESPIERPPRAEESPIERPPRNQVNPQTPLTPEMRQVEPRPWRWKDGEVMPKRRGKAGRPRKPTF